MAQGFAFSSIDARQAPVQVPLGLALQTEMRHQIMAGEMNAPGAFCDGL